MKKNYFKDYFIQISKILSNFNEKDFLNVIQILRKIYMRKLIETYQKYILI
jgi:hypothetical protein